MGRRVSVLYLEILSAPAETVWQAEIVTHNLQVSIVLLPNLLIL